MMPEKKGFLLLELLIASVIICTTGIIISSTFSREIDLTGVTSDYNIAINLLRQKLFDEEFKIKQIRTKKELKEYKASGTFDTALKFSWESRLDAFEGKDNLYIITVKITGIKGERELLLSKWILYKPEQDNEETGDTQSEGDTADEEI